MRTLKSILSTALVLMALSSYSQKVFTSNDRLTVMKAEVSCKNIQFYNDKTIELQREVIIDTAHIKEGKLKKVTQKTNENILFAKKTRAACIDESNGNYLEITFENGIPMRFSANENGNYQLVDRNGKYLNAGDPFFYNKEKYIIVKGNDAQLLFKDNEELKKYNTRRKVSGIKVG